MAATIGRWRWGLAGPLLLLAWAPSAAAEPVTVPVDVGVGPATYLLTGRVADDQPLHFGIKISVQAIIDQEMIRRYQHRIPAGVRRQALRMKEVRYSPSLLIPDALIISPAVENTGVYGVTWRPISAGLTLLDGPGARLQLAAGLLLTYAYIHSNQPQVPETHFARPGLDVGAELEFAPGQPVSVSLGWFSGFYLPQELGGFGLGRGRDLADVLWHVGQAFVKLHFRFPYTTTL
jgi:hypothetical protein